MCKLCTDDKCHLCDGGEVEGRTWATSWSTLENWRISEGRQAHKRWSEGGRVVLEEFQLVGLEGKVAPRV